MFRAVTLTCVAGIAAICAGYGRRHAEPRADLTIADQGHVTTLDPQQVSSSADTRLCTNLWEGLATHDPASLAPVSGIATLPPQVSSDGLRYTFQLRRDSRWTNGDPVTALDFVRGWRRAIEPGTAGDYSTIFTDHVAGAAEYYRWRTRAVGQLRRLAALAAGHALPEAQIQPLVDTFADFGATRDANPAAWARIRQAILSDHSASMAAAWKRVGIRAISAHELQVTLTRPVPYFCDLLLLPVTMPIHESIEALRQGDPETGLDAHGLVVYDSQWTKPDYRPPGYDGLVTNGPYQVSEWRFRRRLRLTANPNHYFAPSLGCRIIDLLMFEDANTAFLAYETGVVDWMVVLSVDFVDELLHRAVAGERPDVHNTPALGTYFYNLNCRDEVLPDGRINPFVDARVRRAFSLAVDRGALCRSVVLKGNPPARTLVPRHTLGGYPDVEGPGHDPAEANRLLDAAGFADRRTFPSVSILYNTGFDHQRVAEAAAHMWRHTLGVSVELQAIEAKTFWAEKARHNFQIARGGWYGDYADPSTFLDIFAGNNGNNDSGLDLPAYDALLQQAAAARDSNQRLALLASAERLLVHEAVPMIPLFQYTNPTAVAAHVHGFQPNPREIYAYRYLEVRR